MPRDYLNYISAPNDSRPLITGFDELTGRPHQGYDPETGHIVEDVPVVAAAEPAPAIVEKVDGQDEAPKTDEQAK